MDRTAIFELINKNPGFFLATIDDMDKNLPRVRGMLLYKADESGIIFHTGAFKDVYKQILKNPNVQLCFFDPLQNIQVRIRGTLKIADSNDLKEEISEHPTRAFLKGWKSSVPLQEFYDSFIVFLMNDGIANVWTIETNLDAKTDIDLF